MGKKSRKRQQGEARPKRQRVAYVDRPFEGLPGETDLVAMREVVPAATGTARTTAEYGAEDVLLVTLLPEMWPALRREDGRLLVALQTVQHSGDASRDVAAALLAGLDLEAGQPLRHLGMPEPGPRLQDVLDTDVPLEVTVHDDFAFWLAGDAERPDEIAAALEQVSERMVPTAPVEGVTSAYWCRMSREFLRWARPEDDQRLLDAFARLHARRRAGLDEDSRFVGAFRTCGILVPVWELPRGAEAAELAGPCREFEGRLAEALAVTEPLDAEERRARAGIVSRQVSLR